MISCHEAVERLWEYLDSTVDEADRVLVEEHLTLCRRCCGELDFAVELRQLLSRPATNAVPADVLQRLQRTLEELEP
jgi:mycothiol system anti-sigma-R factor